ncbi:MAG: tyrosine-type recombinase/integrase [Clostridia bacterium]|nr:tyrosine-type recombinase/integrase [Clostridia bacterium]
MTRITESLIEKYRVHLINEEKSVATIEKYIHDIYVFSKWVGNCEVDKSLVLDYKQHLIENFAPASVNSIISSLNSFFVYNEWHNLRVRTLKIQRQIFASRDKEITKAEYERLLTAAKNKGNQKLYLLMQTICACGIRISELKFITVEALVKMRANINLKGKMRVVIIPGSLCKALMKYSKTVGISSGPVFVSRNGSPLDRSNVWKAMKKLCESANVAKEKVFPHNLRHLFARTFYSVQKDIVRLADILGHTSINTTRIYTMETGEIHRAQIQKLGLLRC